MSLTNLVKAAAVATFLATAPAPAYSQQVPLPKPYVEPNGTITVNFGPNECSPLKAHQDIGKKSVPASEKGMQELVNNELNCKPYGPRIIFHYSSQQNSSTSYNIYGDGFTHSSNNETHNIGSRVFFVARKPAGAVLETVDMFFDEVSIRYSVRENKYLVALMPLKYNPDTLLNQNPSLPLRAASVDQKTLKAAHGTLVSIANKKRAGIGFQNELKSLAGKISIIRAALRPNSA
jgi:hypothetical protein